MYIYLLTNKFICRVLETLTTVGYGEMFPNSVLELYLAIFLMVFGVGFYSYTIANLTSMFSNLDSRQTKLKVNAYIYENII